MRSGIDNLLQECVGLRPGDRVLLVIEPDDVSLFDASVSEAIRQRLHELDVHVTTRTPTIITSPDEFPASLTLDMQHADHTVFLSRVGDFARFAPLTSAGTRTMCYVPTRNLLESAYASVSFRLMAALRDKLEAELMAAKSWRFTCRSGTDLHGEFDWDSLSGGQDDEFSMTLFPVSTFKPVPATTSNGVVAASRWLTPGAAPKIADAILNLDQPSLMQVHDGQLYGVQGKPDAVQKINAHYDRVSKSLGLNRNRVHSWHLGMNPGTVFPGDVDTDLDRWCLVSFASPRYLHIHTCGDIPPGEIVWSVFDPTVFIDGQPFWVDGEFVWLQRDDNRALIDTIPGAEKLYHRSGGIGV